MIVGLRGLVLPLLLLLLLLVVVLMRRMRRLERQMGVMD